MLNEKQISSEMLPAGVFITGKDLIIKYINRYALENIFRLSRDKGQYTDILLDQKFYTTDKRSFDIGGCIVSIIAGKEKSFRKTLILKHKYGESLLYITAREAGPEHYIFVAVDLSSEMDCISYAPGNFGMDDFILGQRLIGNDPKIREIYRKISLAAESMVNVVVTGESGTGKEVVADAIHALSDRRDKPIVKVNCASLSESLLESELFGHVKGAFTGALRDKPGKFELAQGGTIFLDEISEISQALQVKLLRVIQEKEIERVGGDGATPVDMRIIAATNRDLAEMVNDGSFREDLYYRINVFSINVPPLRERPLDIPRLCDHFIDIYNKDTGKNIPGISGGAMRLMIRYPWPGNVRELRNAIEHAFVLVTKNMIDVSDLPESIAGYQGTLASEPGRKPDNGFTRKRGGRLNISRDELKRVLEHHGWNQTQAAITLGISRVALWKKRRKFGM